MANVNPVIHSRAGTYILEAEYPGWTSPEDAVAHVWHLIETGQIMFLIIDHGNNHRGIVTSAAERRWVRLNPDSVRSVHCVPFD